MKKILSLTCVALALISGSAAASVVQISNAQLLGDAVSTGFETCAAGAFAPACSGLPIAGVSAVGGSSASGDVLNSGVSGNTLVRRNGAIVIGAPNSTLDDLSVLGGFHFDLNGTATQFGFRIIDQVNNALIVRTSNGDQLNFTESSGFPNIDRFFESSTAISWFEVLANDSGNNGWGLDNVTLAGLSARQDVPEPATLALLGLGLAGFAAARRRKQ